MPKAETEAPPDPPLAPPEPMRATRRSPWIMPLSALILLMVGFSAGFGWRDSGGSGPADAMSVPGIFDTALSASLNEWPDGDERIFPEFNGIRTKVTMVGAVDTKVGIPCRSYTYAVEGMAVGAGLVCRGPQGAWRVHALSD